MDAELKYFEAKKKRREEVARELEKLEMASKQGLERALASETKSLLQESQAQNKKLLGEQARRALPCLGVLADIDSEPTSGASSDQGQPLDSGV